jgi:hypothetical protein
VWEQVARTRGEALKDIKQLVSAFLIPCAAAPQLKEDATVMPWSSVETHQEVAGSSPAERAPKSPQSLG